MDNKKLVAILSAIATCVATVFGIVFGTCEAKSTANPDATTAIVAYTESVDL